MIISAEFWAFSLNKILLKLKSSLGIVACLFVLLGNPSVSRAQEMHEETGKLAIQYLRSLPDDTKIHVFPTKVRFFEVLGDEDLGFIDAIVGHYNEKYSPYFEMQNYPRFPQISINVYAGPIEDALDRFSDHSNLVPNTKKHVLGLQMGYRGCVFLAGSSRDIWGSSGVIFLDKFRIRQPSEQNACVEAGLDYISGLPAVSLFELEDLPASQVRKVILSAIGRCSKEVGKTDTERERSRDGFTALPTINCVTSEILE